MCHFTVSIDPGSSATKVAYQLTGKPIQYLAMSPFCAQVPSGYPEQRWPHEENQSDLESSWLTLPDKSILFGLAAQKFRGSQVKNSERKFNKALYKVLAILSHIQLYEQLTLPISLGILLPFDEYATKNRLETALRQACDESVMNFCGSFHNLNIQEISIRPEGAGLYLQGLPSGVSGYESRVAVLIIGHRNVSWLVMNQGTPSAIESTTNTLGFRWVLQDIQARSGFKDELALAEMIGRNQGIPDDMQADIEAALAVYWVELKAFLQEQAHTDFVLCGGGAAWLLKRQLSNLFPKLGWATHLSKAVHKANVKDKALAQRMADCYGLLLSLGAKEHV